MSQQGPPSGGSREPLPPWGVPPQYSPQPPYSPQPQSSPHQQPQYPRQHLLPQQVQAPRSRRPLILGIAGTCALILAAVVVFLVVRDDGEDTRAAYCAALRDLTRDGDLVGAASAADGSTLNDLRAVRDLAPAPVADDWKRLESAASSAQSGSPDLAKVIEALGAVRAIARDAEENCDLKLDIPL